MRKLALILCLFVAACGFRPLYSGTNTLTGGTTALDSVWIQTIPGIPGVKLRNALMDRFYNNGTPDNPAYTLVIVLKEDYRDIVIEKDDTTTRSQLVVRANYRLINQATREVVDKGAIRSNSSYNILSSQYTTLVTQDEARDLAIQDVADKITLRLGVVLQKK